MVVVSLVAAVTAFDTAVRPDVAAAAQGAEHPIYKGEYWWGPDTGWGHLATAFSDFEVGPTSADPIPLPACGTMFLEASGCFRGSVDGYGNPLWWTPWWHRNFFRGTPWGVAGSYECYYARGCANGHGAPGAGWWGWYSHSEGWSYEYVYFVRCEPCKSVPLPTPVNPDPAPVSVTSFKNGQVRNDSSTQAITISFDTSKLTCDNGKALPCGTLPPAAGSNAPPARGQYFSSGNYTSARLTSFSLTAPPGFTEGPNPSANQYDIVGSPTVGANLINAPQRMTLRFFQPTAAGQKYTIRATSDVTYRVWNWSWDGSRTTWTLGDPVAKVSTVTYTPNADGTFEVISNVLR